MSRRKVLIVEDEDDIREALAYNLGREGFEALEAADGRRGLELARRHAPDLVLLDLMLPELDGQEVCRRLQADPLTRGIPIIMLTAKTGEADVIAGLALGADDYIEKPFSTREVVARVRAVLRRTGGPVRDEAGAERLIRGALVIDAQRHELRAGERVVDLTATEFRLLHFLASHPGRVFDRAHLLSRVVDDEAMVQGRNIDVHVLNLRKKLGRHRDCIDTVRGVGYRFRGPETQD